MWRSHAVAGLMGLSCVLLSCDAQMVRPVRMNLWTREKQVLPPCRIESAPMALALLSGIGAAVSAGKPVDPQEVRSPGTSSTTASGNVHPGRAALVSATLAEGLEGPDGIAVHPLTGAVFFSEEYLSRIHTIRPDGSPAVVVDDATPVYSRRNGAHVPETSLEMPEGIAFDAAGALYVVEDIPGGRLICFRPDPRTGLLAGEVISVPGPWEQYAWEGIAVGPHGELLIAGSDVQAWDPEGLFELKVFTGAILYRDAEGDWWSLLQERLASFSSVAFSRDGTRVAYTTELPGGAGWIDLSTRVVRQGVSTHILKSPENVCVLPDGRLVVAEEKGGMISLIDPRTDTSEVLWSGGADIETAIWDESTGCLLVAEDGTGRVLAVALPIAPADDGYALDFARTGPLQTPKSIPERCPPFLANVLGTCGLGADSYRRFVTGTPLISVEARTEYLAGVVDEDPISQIAVVVFHPNGLSFASGEPDTSTAVFLAQTRSGKRYASRVEQVAYAALPALGVEWKEGSAAVTVPYPGAVTVSGAGVYSISLLGLGQGPDFHILVNSADAGQSCMVVDRGDGKLRQYRLKPQETGELMDTVVVSYARNLSEQWTWLGREGRSDERQAFRAPAQQEGPRT